MSSRPIRKRVTVTFYVVEPLEEQSPSWEGEFPEKAVLDTARGLDLASGNYHVKTGLFNSEMFCAVYDGPPRLLGGYTKDLLASLQTEFKGSIEQILLREGEGVVDAAYAHFFPNNVLGLLRTSVKSPGSASMANWISLFCGYPCVFSALPTADALSRLERPASEILGVTLRAKMKLLRWLRPVRADVASTFEAAGRVSGSSKAEVTFATATKKERDHWWPGMRAAISDLAAAQLLQDFDAASVRLTGKDSVNLRDAYVNRKLYVTLVGTKRVGPAEAAQALVEAYDDLAAHTILPSVEAWRARRDGRHRPRGTNQDAGPDQGLGQPPGD